MATRNMYEIEIKHDGLNKFRIIKGSDRYVVSQKARAQENQWEEMWQRKLEGEEKKQLREEAARDKEEKLALATELTTDAEKQIDGLRNTLLFTLDVDDKIDWESIKDNSKFDKPEPTLPKGIEIPSEPNKNDEVYQPKLNFIDKLIASRKNHKIEEMNGLFKSDHEEWGNKKKEVFKENVRNKDDYQKLLSEWEKRKKEFIQEQEKNNFKIETQKDNYDKGLPTAVLDYCDMVLTNSVYPDDFPQEFDTDYNSDTKILIVEYSLPTPEAIPKVKEVKYIKTRDEFKETYLSESAINKIYDSLLYQTTLRSLHELLEADSIDAIDAIVFNGWVESIDKGTGKKVNGCVLSIQVTKEEFMEINLGHVDPKTCFKSLKGIGSSKLHSLAPIAPIMKIDRDDPRFVSSYDLADSLNETDNLAIMDWQDFEHLIRELFEKEFNQAGGEVKITQASRDGGVDAIAFDPDPIRGGKLVIQAKRYTNVVGVSAVRDLYGTVLNEGATKGILVSTADYGPDAYKFATGKPLTLLNGSNLLHMLQNHGYKAKIDLKEAKKVMKEMEGN